MSSPVQARQVHHGDAIAWLDAQPRLAGASIITSLPDLSELPQLGFEGWRRWFESAAALAASRVPDDGIAIFFQSDIKHGGFWIDKAALIARGAEQAGMSLLSHRIVCRKPPGTLTFGRPSYSHLVAYAWPTRAARPARATADIIADVGFKPGSKSMGVNACVEACKMVLAETPTRTIIDPFCGWGTVLAVANAMGLDAIGCDVSTRMVRRAQKLVVELP